MARVRSPRSRGPRGTPSAISRSLAVVAWAVRHPGQIHQHRGWVLQGLGLGRILQPRQAHGGTLEYVRPQFLDRHARSLDDPKFVPASEATHMRDEDVVLGVAIDGQAKAYPWWIMDDHHHANDIVAGRPVAIMLCEACSTAVAFDARVDGRRVMFDHGPHYNGTNTLMDRSTRSVWSAYLGTAILGRRRGTKLTLLPLQQMAWGAWLKLHPDTEVLGEEQGSRTGHGSKHTIGHDLIPTSFLKTVARWDARLPPATLVMGAVAPTGQRVYPLAGLSTSGGVVNDDLAGTPIVVTAFQAEGSYGALAFSRVVDGSPLTFRTGSKGPIDGQTGSTWTYEGVAVEGPLAGSRLEFIPSHVSEWYVWAAHFPGIEIWSPRDGRPMPEDPIELLP